MHKGHPGSSCVVSSVPRASSAKLARALSLRLRQHHYGTIASLHKLSIGGTIIISCSVKYQLVGSVFSLTHSFCLLRAGRL